MFWQKVKRLTINLDIDAPMLPQRRKMPKRFEVGNASPEFPSEPEDYYHRIYFEGLDLIVQAISDRFDQPEYHTYRHLQELIFKAIRREDFKSELEFISNFYGSDLNTVNLEMQLNMLGNTISDSNMDIFDVKKYFMDASVAIRSHFSEVVLVLKLILPQMQQASDLLVL